MPRRGLSPSGKAELDRIAAKPDVELDELEQKLRRTTNFPATVRKSIREALDDVIAGRRTRRFAYAQLTSGEKSYCGVRIESVLVTNLQLPPGRSLDVSIGGVDVDIKASSTKGWMIGPRQLNGLLLLLYFSETKCFFSVGVIRAHPEFMNPSNNRDAKRSIAAHAKRHIRWIVSDEALPVSVLSAFPPYAYERIFEASARAERVKRCLEFIPSYVPFPRRVIETVVGGEDPLRGTRADSRHGKTHPLGDLRVLSYQQNKLVRQLGLAPLAMGEHMKVSEADVHRVL